MYVFYYLLAPEDELCYFATNPLLTVKTNGILKSIPGAFARLIL